MTEFVWLCSSANRTNDSCHPDNPTNDIVIEPQLSINRLLISSIELATMEFPRVQSLIESCWGRIHLFRGLPNFSRETLVVEDRAYTFSAHLPPAFNSIVSIEFKDDPIFTTKQPHFLPSFEAQVIGLEQPIIGPFKILSPTSFQAVGTSLKSTFLFSAATLYTPPEPSLQHIGTRLSCQLNESFKRQKNSNCDAFLLEWNSCLSRFVFQILPGALKFFSDPVLIVNCDTSIPLGFNNGRHWLGAKPLIAPFAPEGSSSIKLISGNYLPLEMAEEIDFEFNICLFAPNSILSVSTATLGIVTIHIPEGSYTPISLSETITNLLPSGIQLRYLADEQVYEFSSNVLFNLEFQDQSLTNVAFQFGFAETRYTTLNCYRSQSRIWPQQINDEHEPNFNTTICDMQTEPSFQRFIFFFSRPVPISQATITQDPEDPDTWQIFDQTRALGVQVNDIVEIASVANPPIRLRVVRVQSGLQFSVHAGNLPVPNASNFSVQFVIPATVSILVNGDEMIKQQILGFPQHDLLWSHEQNFLRCPYAFNVNPFTFVMLEMLEPVGSARIEHRFKSDHKTTILGRIILNFEPETERFFPMQATFFSGVRITRFHFRLINQDHSLYQLKGQDFRATFRLVSAQDPSSIYDGRFIENRE
jgi:hypothetical protein